MIYIEKKNLIRLNIVINIKAQGLVPL